MPVSRIDMPYHRRLVVWCVLVTLLIVCVQCSIHRSKNGRPKGRVSNPTRRDNEAQMAGGHSRETWVYATISAILVGLSGIFPLVVIPIEAGKGLRKGGK